MVKEKNHDMARQPGLIWFDLPPSKGESVFPRPRRFNWTFLAATLLCLFFSSSAFAEERWLVLPLENVTESNEHNWLGEGIAVLVSDLLHGDGISVVTPDERRNIYSHLSFSETMIVSRASAIRLAQEADADRLLVGQYKLTGTKGKEQLNVSVQVIDVPAGRLAHNAIEAGAPLQDIVELTGVLVWDILSSLKPPPSISRNDFMSRIRGIPLEPFELYVKALLTEDPEKSLALLKKGLKVLDKEVTFSPAAYELGRAFVDHDQWGDAVPWLTKVRRGDLFYPDAQFALGLCYYNQNELDQALTVLKELSRLVPTPGVYNNLGLVESKRGRQEKAMDYLTVALAANGENPDVWFNAGYALWLNREYEAALEKLREAVSRRKDDGEAHYLISKCYSQLGRHSAASDAMEKAKKVQPKVAQWERSGKVPPLGRLVTILDRSPWTRPSETESISQQGRNPSTMSR